MSLVFGAICISLTSAASFVLCLQLQSEEDLAFEDELARNPYSVKTWMEYIESKKSSRPKVGGERREGERFARKRTSSTAQKEREP